MFTPVRSRFAGATVMLTLLVSAAVWAMTVEARQAAPAFPIDPTWSQEFPHHWVMPSWASSVATVGSSASSCAGTA